MIKKRDHILTEYFVIIIYLLGSGCVKLKLAGKSLKHLSHAMTVVVILSSTVFILNNEICCFSVL